MAVKLQFGRLSILHKGDYNISQNYEKLDIVSYRGNSYICIKDNIGILPTNTEYWRLMAKSGEDGKSAYEIYRETITHNKEFIIVDHTNFADARHNQLEDYYNNYPVEAQQDGETWPAFYPPAFPWLVVNHAFDGNIVLKIFFRGEEVMSYIPTAKVEAESGELVDRTYAIIGIPSIGPSFAQYAETSGGTDILTNKDDFKVVITDNNMSEEEWVNSLKGIDGINGQDGQDGKSAYDLYVDQNTTVCNTWLIVDHRNFAEARHNQLEDYYNNYPVEAQQDGETWPPFTASKFPWLVVNYNFDGNTTANFYYKDELKLSWKPSAKVEQESGNFVDRTYGILSIPEEFNIPEFTETIEGTDVFIDPNDIRVELTTALSLNDWLESLKGKDGSIGAAGKDGKSAYELYVSTVPAGQTPMTIEEWLASLKGNTDTIDISILNNYATTEYVNNKFDDVLGINADGISALKVLTEDSSAATGLLKVIGEKADSSTVYTKSQVDQILQDISINGVVGQDGKSAYEIAVDNGFTGDVSAWLESLKGVDGHDGVDGINGIDGIDGIDGKSAYELYLESNTTLSNSWLIVDHTNFAEARHNQLEDYYNNYPVEAQQDGETWPAWTPSAFPWIVVNHNFDGNTTLIVKYLGEEVFRTLPSAEVEQESGNMVQRTYSIWSLPNNLGLTQFTETSQGTAILANPADFRVELISNYMNQSEWLDSLKGTNGVDGSNGINGKSAYELAVDNGYEGNINEWLDSLKGTNGVDGSNGINGKSAYEIYVDNVSTGDPVLTESEWLESLIAKADMSNVYTKDEVNQKFTDLVGSAPEAFDTLKEISDELTNSSTAVTAIINTLTHKVDSSVVYTKQEIDASIVEYAQPKGNYLTEHQDISNKADKSELPTKVSDLENDSKYLTAIDVSQFLTEHQSLDEYAKIEDINSSINDINSSIINSDASIESIKQQLTAINSSWANYLTVESFNEFLEADADETINKFNEIVDFLAGIDTTDDTLYNTLQSINTSINDISSRLHDIDSSWNNYYTKEEIDDTIEAINASIANSDSSIVIINEKIQNIDSSWDNYYDKETIDASIIEYAQPKGEYLTEHQDLTLLATKFEVSTNYYNKHEVESLITTTGTFSPEMYYTKTDINEMLVNNTSAFITQNDTSKFITSQDVSQFITLNDTSIYLTEHQSLEEYDNSIEALNTSVNTIEEQLASIDSSWVNYYDKETIDASIIEYAQPKGEYLTEQSLDEYAKIEDINSSINDINSSIINSDASISEIKEQISAIDSSWDNYYTKEEVNTTIDDINTSINNMSTRVDNIDSSWNNYYTKEEINGTFDTINASINIVDSSIVRIDETIGNIQEAVDNADSSIEYIKGQLENIDSSWASYLTVDSFNKFLEADADETINKFNEIVDFLAGIDTTDDTLYNTLQSINTSINDISSRLHDIDSSWNNYYTKDEIDDTIEVVNASIINSDSSIVTINEKLQNIDSSWDNYYDKETIDASIVEYAQPKGEYLTEHQDLSLLATKFEVSTGYYNKHEVEQMITATGTFTPELYYTKTDINEKLINDTSNFITQNDASIYLTEHQSLEEYDNSIEAINTSVNNIEELLTNIDSSWDSYYTKDEIDDVIEILNISINISDSSIIRIDETIDNIQGAVENADSSIEYIKGQLANIDSSWENYLTVETFNNLVQADADETINKFNEIVDFLAGIDTTDEVLYNKLFSINASINDISIRLHNIDSSWNNYYTKEEINDTIEAVNASISNSDSSITIINEKLQNIDSSWDNYYNKETIDASIVAYAQPKGDYALNTDISANYYTKTQVDKLINESDIFNAELYYTKDDIDNSHFLVANDVSNKLEANDISTKLEANDVSIFLTANDISSFLTADDISNKLEANDVSIFLTANDISTKLEANDISIFLTANDISTKADKSELFSGSYEDLTDKPDIPEKVSDLTNDAEYTTISDLSTAIANLVNSAPETLDTLGEVAEALNNADTSIIAILDTIGNKANKEDVYTKTQIDASIIEYAQPKGEYLTNADLEGYVENSSITENYVSKNDASIYLTEHQSLDEYAKKTDISAFLVANDISTKADKSELPTKVSELENDSSYLTTTDVSQFLTEHQSLDEYAKIADVDSSLSNIKDSIENADASIIAINTHLENIDSSWQNYYSKEELNANNDIINASVNNADASIESIKQQLLAIDSSWQNYLTVETFNDLVEADADGTINKFNEIVDFLAGIDTEDDTLYNTLYSINASINDISSRLHNIDSSWAYYYTKDEIDNNHFLVANDVSNFLTEHQSLDEYAKIADADASIAELKEFIEKADASISNITTRIDDIDSLWYNYYSKEEINSTIDNINDAISMTDASIAEIDASIAEIKESLSNQNYYSTDEIDSIIGTVNASISNTDASIISINTHLENIDSSWQNYYSKDETNTIVENINVSINNADASIVDIKAAIENIDSSWQNYYDKTTIDASIIEYAQPKGEYLIANDISTKADKSELPTKVSDLQNDSEYVTNASMNARFTELIGAAPEAYDTLKEIADKLGDDDASLGTLFNMLADKSDVSTTYTKDQVDTLLTENYLTNTEVSTLLQDYALNASINTIFNTNDSNVDLEIADPSGNTLVAFYGGHMRTKYFDSAAVNSSIDGLIDTINSGALLPTIGEDPSSNDPNDIYWFIAGQKTEYRATPKIINITASDYQALSEKDETAIYVITDAFNNINGNNIEYTIGNVSSTSNINDLDVSIHKNNNVVSFDFTLPIANIDMSNLTEQQLALLQGKSNYDIYVENHDSAIDGSLLSEAEWLETLKGTTGDEGKSAYQLYVDAYEIANGDTAGAMTQDEWLNSLTPQINADASNNLYWYINGNKSQYKAFPEIRYITAAEYDALTDTDDSIIYIITSSQDASALSFNVGTVTTTDMDTDVSVNIRRVNSSVYFDFVLPFSVDSSKYRGKSAYQSYLDTLPSGTEPMTEANWVNSLRGKSAYELFLEANPTTPYDTSAKWFASLKGADGSTGPVGPQGPATDVSIDSDGYWVINGMVTNKSAKGIVPNISIGIYRDTNTNEDVALNTWWIDGIDTHIPTSQGVDINTLESRLGQLGNKVNAVPATYYTAEEAAAYNTEHELSSGDPGYVSEGDLKTAAIPAVPYTVKDYVDDHQPNIDTSNLYTKSEVDQLFADLIDSAPATLDTLKEIADKLSADDTSLGELHMILSNKCDTSTTYTKTQVDTLLQSYVTTEYFNEHNTGGSSSIDPSALADYALKTYVDSKIGTLPNKTDDVYYTQEECDIYNTSNNLTSEDEGFLTTSIIKDPSTQYTDIVDAIEETEEVIAAMLINFNNSINDISSRVATLSATPTPAIWVGTQSEYNLLDPISETTIYIIKADTSLS